MYEDPIRMNSQSKTIKKMTRNRSFNSKKIKTQQDYNSYYKQSLEVILNILFKDIIKGNILKRNTVTGKEKQEDIKTKHFLRLLKMKNRVNGNEILNSQVTG